MPKTTTNIEIHPDNFEALNDHFRQVDPDPDVRRQTMAAMSWVEKGLKVTADDGALEEMARINETEQERMVLTGNHSLFFDPLAFAAAVHTTPEIRPLADRTIIFSKPAVHTMAKFIPPLNREIQKRVESVGSTLIWRPQDIERANDPNANFFRKIGEKAGLLAETEEWLERKKEIGKNVNSGFSKLALDLMKEGKHPFLYPEGGRNGDDPRTVGAFNKGVALIVVNAVRADMDVSVVPVGIGYEDGPFGFRNPALHIGTPINQEWKRFKDVVSIAHEATQSATDKAFESLDARAA